jgi:predicted methyltransferase
VVNASEKSPRPVKESKPTKTSAPMPDASRPGNATRLSVAPPIPAASMIRNAPRMGEPSSVLTAAKLPADAMMVRAIGGASFFTRCTASAARPPPIAIKGASGPSTAPRHSVLSAARKTADQFRPGRRSATGLEPEGG